MWIETSSKVTEVVDARVTPHVGVWIETFTGLGMVSLIVSHLM